MFPGCQMMPAAGGDARERHYPLCQELMRGVLVRGRVVMDHEIPELIELLSRRLRKPAPAKPEGDRP